MRGGDRVAAGLGRLADAAGGGLVLANSDGLLTGPGRRLKAAQIRAFRPDLLLTLGEHPALDAVLVGHPDLPVLQLASSPHARRKTRGERRQARQEAFRGYFADAVLWTAALGVLAIEGASAPEVLPPPRLLVGLGDRAGRDLALGIVTGTDPSAGALTLLMVVPRALVHRVRTSTLALDENFREAVPAWPRAARRATSGP